MGSTFFSQKKQRFPWCSVGPRARELPSWSGHRVGRGHARRQATASGQQLSALCTAGAVTRGWCTQLSPAPAPTKPPQKKAQCCLGPRASVARGVSSLADFSLGAAPRRDKAPSPFKPTLQRLPSPNPSSQELSDTTVGAHPRTISPWKEVERRGDSEVGGKEVGTPVCSIWGGLGKWSKRE